MQILLAISLFSVLFVFDGQQKTSPYQGEEQRSIKALSADEIQAYLEGRGMGFAKAAELNGYPGPKHVLEHSTELKLTERQVTETKRIFDRMHSEAVGLGRQVVARESALDRLFAGGTPSQSRISKSLSEISTLQGKLRAAHLRAHLEMKAVLTEAQIKEYSRLRGYNEKEGSPAHHRREH
jgi:Spy/CpxP family protein refolding chaperone